jgi:hypothetical protein
MVHPLHCRMRLLVFVKLTGCHMSGYLATGTRAAGKTRALCGLLATGDLVARPLPAGASTRGAKDVGVGARAGNTDSVISHGKTSDWDTSGGLREIKLAEFCGRVGYSTYLASGGAILVVLLNNNTVLGDSGENISRVSDAGDFASGTVDSLNTETVLRVGDLVVQELDVGDSVIVATADGSDRETVATSAGGARNGDVRTRVDSDTVVLNSTSVLRV